MGYGGFDRQGLLGGGGLDQQLVLLRPPPQRQNGLSGQISSLIDIDYETLVLLLGVAGAGASWVLYQAILTKGRRAFRRLKPTDGEEGAGKLGGLLTFLQSGRLAWRLLKSFVLSHLILILLSQGWRTLKRRWRLLVKKRWTMRRAMRAG